MRELCRVQVIDRAFVPNFVFSKKDTIVAVGQDGLVANTLKYLEGQPVIGVNPDPDRWEGVLLPFEAGDLRKVLPDVFSGKRRFKEVTMAKAHLNNGLQLYAVNDLFIGPKSHVSVRYEIKVGDQEEQHSSSGIIVSTGMGSTGWFKSLMAGAAGIAGTLSGQKIDVPHGFPWDANYLYFTVREPFPSKNSSANLVFGTITNNQPMILVSAMPENGVIFSDGIEADFLEFNSGTRATISVAEKKGYLVL